MKTRVIFFVMTVFVLGASLLLTAGAGMGKATERWQGVDESVVEKYAAENGRASREPLINTDQGDLLPFVFLLAGVVGGFAAGYSWRMLVAEKVSRPAAATGNIRKTDAPV